MSFSCDHCGFSNTEIQSAGQIQEKGAKYSLKVTESEDLERQLVKSDTAVFRLEDLDIEIPAGHGRLTNVEGVLSDVLRDLEAGQKQRKKEQPEIWEKVDAIVQSLLNMMLGRGFPFTISLDDPTGNGWIEPSSTDKDGKYRKTEYTRTTSQNAELGLGQTSSTEDAQPTATTGGPTPHLIPQIPSSATSAEKDSMEEVDILEGQMYSFQTPCPGCAHSAHINMQLVNIPHFKQVVISAVMCLNCNYRSSDVKTGGEIPPLGKKIWLDVREPDDLRRDILKSETCLVRIEEIGVEVQPGTMGGRFTTVEGLLTQIRDDLKSTVFDIDDVAGTGGDSMPEDKKIGWEKFFAALNKAIAGESQYTILLEDPLANSYVQDLFVPEPDPRLHEEEYERTEEENEELGISDMKTRMGQGGEYEQERFELKGGEEGETKDGVNPKEVEDTKEIEAEKAKVAELIQQVSLGDSA